MIDLSLSLILYSQIMWAKIETREQLKKTLKQVHPKHVRERERGGGEEEEEEE